MTGPVRIAKPIVPIAWREPFSVGSTAYRDVRPEGETILDMVRSVPDLPARFWTHGVVCVGGHPVARFDEHGRDLWKAIRPKAYSETRPIVVTMHLPLGGGGGRGGGSSTAKSVGALVAAFALVVVTGGIAGGFLAPVLGSAFAAGTLGANILAGAVGLAGALAISALTPPPSLAAINNASSGPLASNNTDQAQPASATGNALTPGGAIPRVIGTRKIFPPLVGEPIVELVDNDEYVEAAFALNGPHLWSDIRVDGVTIADATDLEYETFEGWASDGDMTLCVRQGKTTTPQVTLSTHIVNSNSQANLAHPESPSDDLPVFHTVASRSSPDEIWLHFLLPNGISVNGSTSTDVVIPLRVKIRKKGAVSWTNLPEIHVSDSTLQQRRRALIFKFETAPSTTTSVVPPTAGGFVYANIAVPGQSAAPATSGWSADSYFVGASGTSYLASTNVGGSKVKNLALYDNRTEIFLDPDTFMPGIYEIQVQRGAAFLASSFTRSSYQYSGSVKDFFTYAGTTTPAIPMSRSNLADTMQLVRCVSIWNDYPVLKRGKLALLAIRARNRDVKNVSSVASGYVKDWDGSGWNNWTTTSYPAAHYADVLCGSQNLDPLPTELRDDTGLVAWRTKCIANGWKCDAIIDDFRTQDALTLIASCGYGKPYQSEIYGVTVDYDRSAETPVQVFSRRNAKNVRMEKAFARVPEGFIVNYVDKDDDYNNAQVVVYQRDISAMVTGLLETVTYDGLVDRAAAEARALFDLDQGNLRATNYYFDTDIENIVCRRGDLIGIQHDILTKRCGDGVVKTLVTNGSNIIGLVLDATISVTNVSDMHATTDMHAVTDMHDVGVTAGIAIRRNDGTISTHELSNSSGDTATLTLSTPISNDGTVEALDDTGGTYGALVTAGALGAEYRRVLVSQIRPTKDLGASLTNIDEAQDLVRYAA